MPRFLLDTNAFLRWVDAAPDLSDAARRVIANENNVCFLSMASCWEMAIKSNLGKLRISKPIENFVSEHLTANGFALLQIELRHLSKIEKMPFHHRDPFDRLLIAQAISEKLALVSSDAVLAAYGVKVVW
ncbi:MAG: type II toxin-antitoxin system VapC family toxin [Desulfobacteraceae bacterium]|nr:type II toxin-antitoxin system VapC family toxin [Desulfobacteraceae bacterium]MBU4001773.1 type II toxin-antitoxin system VapC family toxin [Pseudomonadota bacterium]MBU4055714.1 type II toxin-antitoxin system VapC family toxin [Pseudomonadota bacterium]